MGRPRGDARALLVRGAFESLRTHGYAGSSSRVVGRVAGVNPALIFYYFGDLDTLFVEALAVANAERLDRHRAAIAEARSFKQLLDVLARIYGEDMESGYLAVVTELVAAGITRPELGARLTEEMQHWLDLVEGAVASILEASGLAELASAQTVAHAGIVFYLGANLLTRLVGPEPVEEVLTAARQATAAVEALQGGADG